MKGNGTVISVCSGKGGVGKTFTSINLARSFAKQGFKTLLIDLDYNLANCSIHFGLPLNDDFIDFLKGSADWIHLVQKIGDLDYISTCNGNREIFLGEYRLLNKFVELITQAQGVYDYIVFDTGSGLVKEQCNLMSLADIRLLVFRPEASSMTDGYSLFKILHQYYGNRHFGFIINDYEQYEQVNRAKSALISVAEKFTQEQLLFFGSVPHLIHKEGMQTERSSTEEFFLNISQNMVEYWMKVKGKPTLHLSKNNTESDFALREY